MLIIYMILNFSKQYLCIPYLISFLAKNPHMASSPGRCSQCRPFHIWTLWLVMLLIGPHIQTAVIPAQENTYSGHEQSIYLPIEQ